MKKILLISDLFFPNNIIGALRPTKIAKGLTARGYTVDVFTRFRVEPHLLQEAGICNRLYAFQDLPKPESAAETAPGFLGHLKKNIKQNHPALFGKLKKLTDFSYYWTTIREAREMKSQLENLVTVSEYDVIFSTFGPLSSVLCGLACKQKEPKIKWICDFRDPMVSKHVPSLLRPLFRHYQQTACREADEIVTVSNGYLDRICQGQWKEKSHMIPNGYDLADFAPVPAEKSRDQFTITYVGALYGGDRDLSPMFRAIEELVLEGICDPAKLRLSYAGDEPDVFIGQAAKYHTDSMVVNQGILPRKACLDLQFRSHMLVLSTWNDQSDYGVFPGKLLEYMLIGAPILSLTCGTLPDGEVTRVIREGKFGIAYEQVRDRQDYPALKAYLKNAYQQWQAHGSIEFQPDPIVLDRYNYENILSRIEALMKS